MDQQSKEDSVRNAFACVSAVYKETSLLLKDFEAAIGNYGFVNMVTGSSISTADLSRNINRPSHWLTRYAGLFFKPEYREDANHTTRAIGIAIQYCNFEGEAIRPLLLIGVMEGHLDQQCTSWWLASAYFDEDGNLQYKNKNFVPGCPEKIDGPAETSFESTKEGSNAPRAGWMLVMPLMQVTSADRVKELAEKAVSHWRERFGAVVTNPQ